MLCSGSFGCWDIVSAQESRIWGTLIFGGSIQKRITPVEWLSRHKILIKGIATLKTALITWSSRRWKDWRAESHEPHSPSAPSVHAIGARGRERTVLDPSEVEAELRKRRAETVIQNIGLRTTVRVLSYPFLLVHPVFGGGLCVDSGERTRLAAPRVLNFARA